jgi:hypothetical protein
MMRVELEAQAAQAVPCKIAAERLVDRPVRRDRPGDGEVLELARVVRPVRARRAERLGIE